MQNFHIRSWFLDIGVKTSMVLCGAIEGILIILVVLVVWASFLSIFEYDLGWAIYRFTSSQKKSTLLVNQCLKYPLLERQLF